MVATGSRFLNLRQGASGTLNTNAPAVGVWQPKTMDGDNAPDWFLRDWMKHCGKKQASLVNDLGWNKSRAHKVWHSGQSYGREDVNEIASYLGIAPHELLMPPTQALALRRLRAAALQIAGEVALDPLDPDIAEAALEKRSR